MEVVGAEWAHLVIFTEAHGVLLVRLPRYNMHACMHAHSPRGSCLLPYCTPHKSASACTSEGHAGMQCRQVLGAVKRA